MTADEAGPAESADRTHTLPRHGRRTRDAHKGNFGRVLLVVGSRAMPGAAVLTARAALRAGSGLVTIAVPDDIAVAFPSAVPEATLFLLPPSTESDPSRFRERLEEALAENWDAIGIGPGLGVDPAKQALVEAIGEWRGPQCFDADALNNVAKGIVVDRRADRVWTPHPGEFRRLTARLPVTRSERLDCARAF